MPVAYMTIAPPPLWVEWLYVILGLSLGLFVVGTPMLFLTLFLLDRARSRREERERAERLRQWVQAGMPYQPPPSRCSGFTYGGHPANDGGYNG